MRVRSAADMLAGVTLAPNTVRRLGADDVDAVVDLTTLCEIAETGDTDAELIDWLVSEGALDDVQAFGIDDESGLAVFGFVECRGGRQGLEADVRVRPGRPLDLGLPVLDAVRAAAAAYDPSKPLHIFTNAAAAPQRAWLETHGGREIRHFWRMAIDLPDDEPALPAAPAGVVVRRARDDEADLRAIFAVTDISFAEHFGHTEERIYDDWIRIWRSRRGFDLSLWWVVETEADRLPIAVLLAMTIDNDGAVIGNVGTLGTLKEHRGRGIGTYLLRLAFAEFHRRGLRHVTLGVDSENGTGAVKLYESVGMHPTADWALYELESGG